MTNQTSRTVHSALAIFKSVKTYGVAVIALLCVLAGGAYLYRASRPVFPPKDNVCFDMLLSALASARSHDEVTVPQFSVEALTHVRCSAEPGMTHGELAGTDMQGNAFTLILTSGGRAASGADTVFDYCYKQNDALVSEVRITGRDGTHSTSSCTYNEATIPSPVSTYLYDRM